jgi:hypothetical protein
MALKLLEKQCASCLLYLPLDNFTMNRAANSGKSSHCRACAKERLRLYRTLPGNSAHQSMISRAWRLNNPERAKRGVRSATLKKKYGITADDYDDILRKQGGGCAICGSTVAGGNGGDYLHVDHDHATGQVRALLCQPCNTSIGQFKDDPALLRKAADYVEKWCTPCVS